VVAVVGASAAAQDDGRSAALAGAALAALAPAWLGAGRPARDLAAAVVAALPRAPAHRRLPLLAALLPCLPRVRALAEAAQLGWHGRRKSVHGLLLALRWQASG